MKKLQYFLLFFLFHFVVIKSCHFILISAPGSGKGTFSQYMVQKHGYVQICPGDIFRKEILLQTELGKAIQPIVEAGDYVDEDIVCTLMEQYIQKSLEQNKLFILDGFPRSEHSLKFLLEILNKKQIIEKVYFLQFQAPDEICKQRMLNRYVCNSCGQVDNTNMIESLEAPSCNSCGDLLVKRSGDKEEVITKRLEHFHKIIEPLLEKIKTHKYPIKYINSVQKISVLEEIYANLSL